MSTIASTLSRPMSTSTSSILAESASTTLSTALGTTTILSPPTQTRNPPQPKLIFGFVVAALLLFVIVMGGGMLARVYKDRQREAQLARENAALIDLRPSMDEVWLSPRPHDVSRTPEPPAWTSMRPLAASILLPSGPVVPPSPNEAGQPFPEMHMGQIASRTHFLLPPALRKKSKRAVADDRIHATLQTAVLVRMPAARQSAAHDHVINPASEEQPLLLDIGTYEIPWSTDTST